MDKNPLVSIIIPTYGRSELLVRAIDSVLMQSYSNLEIIVVDDNGENTPARKKTKSILKNYINQKQIIYLELTKNVGGALARNKGVEISKGKLICFLDDDDEFLPNKVQLQVNKHAANKYELSVVGGYANILDKNGSKIRTEKNNISGDIFKLQLKMNICTTSIAMINKDIFLMAGGFSNVPSSQEHMMFLKMFEINPYYHYVNEPVVNIYHHDGDRISTGTKRAEGAILLHKFVTNFYDELTEEEIKETDIAHYINIIRAYMQTINNRPLAIKYFNSLIRKNKKIDSKTFKSFLIICFGQSGINKMKLGVNTLFKT